MHSLKIHPYVNKLYNSTPFFLYHSYYHYFTAMYDFGSDYKHTLVHVILGERNGMRHKGTSF